jgi:very-short-patch-repair endonuclease
MAEYISVQCPDCQEWRNIRARDLHKVTRCQRCHMRRIAAKGWAKTALLYGTKFAVEKRRAWALRNPSSLEQRVMRALNTLGVSYEREYWLEDQDTGKVVLVDFLVGGAAAIEVDGTWAHQFHAERDAWRQALITSAGYPLLVLDESTVKDPEQLRRYLGMGVTTPPRSRVRMSALQPVLL